MANQRAKSEWLNSIQTLLESVDHDYIQSCSISVVPEGLKKWNHDAYMPRVVTIGPRFKGKREDLLLMEEVKLRCMLSLIHRGAGGAGKSLEKCSEAVWDLDEEVRASYVGDIELEKHELGKIMLLDGCFLLELLISKGLDSKLRSRLLPPGPAAEVLKDQDVLSDLMLLENQIPILVLHKLSQTLFPNVFEQDKEKQKKKDIDPSLSYSPREENRIEREEERKRERRAKKINNLALDVLGYSPLQIPCLEAPHILDLVHYFVNGGRDGSGTENQCNHVIGIMDGERNLKLKRCALRLEAAGVTIQLVEDKDKGISCLSLMRNCFGGVLIRLGNFIVKKTKQVNVEVEEAKGLDFHFKFKKGKLEISQLHITETTKAKWRNVIVWEHHKMNRKSSSVSAGTGNGKFTTAALIFDGLICCSADVKFLKEKNIIMDHTKMSNDKLKEFFGTMKFGVDHEIIDSSYVQLVDELNNYSEGFFILRMLKILWHFFMFCVEWLIKFLKQNYNFVAALLALLSVVQTVYAILAYYFHK